MKTGTALTAGSISQPAFAMGISLAENFANMWKRGFGCRIICDPSRLVQMDAHNVRRFEYAPKSKQYQWS